MKKFVFFLCIALVASELKTGQNAPKRGASPDSHSPGQKGNKLKWLQTNVLPVIKAHLTDIRNFLPTWGQIMKAIPKNSILEYLQSQNVANLTDPCVVLNDMVLIADKMFDILFNRQLTFDKIEDIPLIMDGGKIADIKMSTAVILNIDKINFAYNECSFDEEGLNSTDKIFRGSVSFDTIDLTLQNYAAKGTLIETIAIDSTGQGRIKFEDLKVSLMAPMEPEGPHTIYTPTEYDIYISVQKAMVKFEADGNGNDLETFINAYLSVHIYDMITMAQIYLNTDGDIYDTILMAIDSMATIVDASIEFRKDEKLAGAVYDKLGCASTLGNEILGTNTIGLSDLALCVVKMLDLGTVECIKIIKNSGVIDLILTSSE